MRSFGFYNNDIVAPVEEARTFTPVDGEICYAPSVYDDCMYDKTPDGDLIQCDMTQILLNQEKFRHLLGDANIQKIIDGMHPTMSTPMDDMTDDQRFDAVISRHCQTMSERQAVLSELASRFGDVKQMLSEIQKESEVQEESVAEPANASAPAASE